MYLEVNNPRSLAFTRPRLGVPIVTYVFLQCIVVAVSLVGVLAVFNTSTKQ